MADRIIKRIITCQGSIQLVAALAALRCREEEQAFSYRYENYLIIYQLCIPTLSEQGDRFALFIKKMAQELYNWKAIIYIDREMDRKLIKELYHFFNHDECSNMIHNTIGTDIADEIYLINSWQSINPLLINAYRGAKKILFGDSVGIYSPASYMRNYLNPKAYYKLYNARADIDWDIFKKYFLKLKRAVALGFILKNINFDTAYFLLEDTYGKKTNLRTVMVKSSFILDIFKKSKVLLDKDYIINLWTHVINRPIVILVASLLSEQKKMSLENEVLAYKEFLQSQCFPKESVLLIKPHPRMNPLKIERLQSILSDLFSDIIPLIHEDLFFIPFEVFLMEMFFDENLKTSCEPKIVTFSSACLSLSLLFKIKPFIGFGDAIIRKFFYGYHVSTRIRHEFFLQNALDRIQKRF